MIIAISALLACAIMAVVKLWHRSEELLAELQRKDREVAYFCNAVEHAGEIYGAVLSAVTWDRPELIPRTDPRYSHLYRAALYQRQLLEEMEAIAVNRGATLNELSRARERVEAGVRSVVDAC